MNCCLESAGTDAGRCPQEEGRVRGCRWTVQDAAVDGACLWLPANRTAPQRSHGRIQDNPEGMDLGEVLSPDAGQCWPCLSCTLCKVSSCHGIRGCSQGQDGRPPPPPSSGAPAPKTRARPAQAPSTVGQTPPIGRLRGPGPPPSSEALPHQVPKTGLRSWDGEGWDRGGPPFK